MIEAKWCTCSNPNRMYLMRDTNDPKLGYINGIVARMTLKCVKSAGYLIPVDVWRNWLKATSSSRSSYTIGEGKIS